MYINYFLLSFRIPRNTYVIPFVIVPRISEALFTFHDFILCTLNYIFYIDLSSNSLTLLCHLHCNIEPSSDFWISGIIVFSSRRVIWLYFTTYIFLLRIWSFYSLLFTSQNIVKTSDLKYFCCWYIQHWGHLGVNIWLLSFSLRIDYNFFGYFYIE